MAGIHRQKGCCASANPQRIPLWVIGRDNLLLSKIRNGFEDDRLIVFDRSFPGWQSAMRGLKSSADPSPLICLVDRVKSRAEDLGWLSLFRNLAPAVSLVLLMGEIRDEEISCALSAGVAGFLGKPYTFEQLLSTVRVVAEGQVAMSPAILEHIRNLTLPGGRPGGIGLLTDREKEILTLIVEGCSTQQIADRLFISYFTVDTHLKNIYSKLEVKKRSSLVALLLREHILF